MSRVAWTSSRPFACIGSQPTRLVTISPCRGFFTTQPSHSGPSWLQPWRARWHAWLERSKPVATHKLTELSHKWNDYSGYAEINLLKQQVQNHTHRLKDLQTAKDEAKSVYIQAVSERSMAQRKTNDLLSRKSTWNDTDLLEYTKLLHSEHSYAKAEESSQHQYEAAEAEMQRGFDDLMRSVMRRYHEEHLWSDRVRSMSTYASIGLGALNVLIFILALFLVEPYKRRKLAQTLETRLIEGEERARERMHQTVVSVDERLSHLEEALLGSPEPHETRKRVVTRSLALPSSLRWVSHIWQYLQAWHSYAASLWEHINPIPANQGTSVAATATGVVVGSMVSYWLALLCL